MSPEGRNAGRRLNLVILLANLNTQAMYTVNYLNCMKEPRKANDSDTKTNALILAIPLGIIVVSVLTSVFS